MHRPTLLSTPTRKQLASENCGGLLLNVESNLDAGFFASRLARRGSATEGYLPSSLDGLPQHFAKFRDNSQAMVVQDH